MSEELYRDDGRDSRSVRVRIEDGAVVVDTQDMGPVAEGVWGDSDYEFWTSVKKEHWGVLIVALLKELLAGDPRATDRLRKICEKHGVPHEWDRWA